MKENKVLQVIIVIVALVIFEGFFFTIAPSLLGADVAYKVWGRSNMGLFIFGVVVTVYQNKKNKK